MVDCLCGARLSEQNLKKHLAKHSKEELEDMLLVWLEAEANLEEAFSDSRAWVGESELPPPIGNL